MKRPPLARSAHASQRGVAVVTALLVTVLAVTLVAGLFGHQQLQLRLVENQLLQAQARSLLRGAIDLARLDLQDGTAGAARLDSALGLAPGASLAQQVQDAQARFNLANLASAGKVNLFQRAAFARLLATLRLDPDLAARAAAALADPGAAIGQLDDLAPLAGFTAAVREQLRPFVVVLPEPTAVNVNTAPAEVLTTVADCSLQEARVLVAQRRLAPYRDASDFALRLNDKATLEGVNFSVASDFFLVHSQIRLEHARLASEALLRRSGAGGAVLLALRAL
ncbi:MAG: type II secretion system minor pseudopilin GspK [Pseudomonadota bacterium]